jgi:hypothetical protein
MQTPLSIIAAICFILSGFLICRLHALVTDLDPLETMVSEYALDPQYGSLMHISFFVLGTGAVLQAISIFKSSPPEMIQAVVLVIAGMGAALMGVFSMQSRLPSEHPSSAASGKVHDTCVLVSFTSVLISMILLACWPVQVVDGKYPWLRGVALVDFNICALTTIFFAILGYNMQRKLTGSPAMVRMQAVENVNKAGSGDPDPNEKVYVSMFNGLGTHRKKLADEGDEAVKTANRGQGLLERILIFMFIAWGLILSCITISRIL